MDNSEDEQLQDFLMNFKFPWEQETEGSKPVYTISRPRTLSDTTPARRAKRISGKILLNEFSNLSNQTEEPDPTANLKQIVDEIPKGELTHDTDSNENETKESAVHNESGSSLSSKKRKKRQSNVHKRRQSVALLKTIGVITSPITEQLSPSKTISSKKVKSSSRRRSSRLSGMMAPLLELGNNGIPKLVHLQEGILCGGTIGYDSKNIAEEPHDPKHHGSSDEVDTIVDDVFFDMLSPSAASSVGMSRGLENDKVTAGYRIKFESPITPLGTQTNIEDYESEQYTTPQDVDMSCPSYTPDERMLSTFHSLKLESEFSTPRQTNVSESHVTDCFEQEFVSRPESDLVDRDRVITEAPLEICSEECNTSEETQQLLHCERTVGCDVFETLRESDPASSVMDIDKENISDYSPLERLEENVEIDQKVKDYYLKKGQIASRKKKNSNLETVFEELKPDDVGIGKRKFKRSLAFPEKPWQPRKGTKRNRMKKKRMSLSRKPNKHDILLQERLTNILDGLAAEDS